MGAPESNVTPTTRTSKAKLMPVTRAREHPHTARESRPDTMCRVNTDQKNLLFCAAYGVLRGGGKRVTALRAKTIRLLINYDNNCGRNAGPAENTRTLPNASGTADDA